MYKDSKIYVAGHTGLLGSALMKRLIGDGYSNVITQLHSELELTDKNSIFDFFSTENPEYVFLAAGKVGGIESNKSYPAEYLHVNLAIQDNIFEAAQKYAVKHLIFYGSSCIYPKQCLQPMKEEYLLTGLTEETSEGYATAKISGIIGCKVYNQQYNTNRFIALIPSSMYGPNDNFDIEHSHVISALIRRFHEAKVNNHESATLWGSGKPRREFIYSEDIAGASVFAMQNADRFENRHYNIGTGADYSIKELASITAKIVGFDGEILWDKSKPDGAQRKLLDSTKFLSFGWKPRISIEEGLRRTYEWYQEQSVAQAAI
ncbi:MAG: GDP-L-fucose synthase [Planctomycetota bacterium]|nr:MAG: GDP-L-fucose synthase [Planctomycetota bacterium]